MANINISATAEQLKAVNGIVEDAVEWLQQAWDSKAESCIKRVIKEESNVNYSKLTEQQKKDWIKDNTFKTRKEKDEEI